MMASNLTIGDVSISGAPIAVPATIASPSQPRATHPGPASHLIQWEIVKEIAKTLEVSGKLTVPASLEQIMGCESSAELALKENMVSSPEVVLSFLHDTSIMALPKAEKV
ncbi:probable mitochondrial intermediate peptidase mitochondrial [Phtheirospermum japonicum]|uniref:Probable mitochondrial intermediate peptidase mitochondrial n=1 Tax=Phtheirospermum japonicum TaxID=374723 RepID=A0A830B3D4_9LAMI|nr:probable mitochondrial intermediate peptidase mitochondrial [Phtheirospermum japonicum]